MEVSLTLFFFPIDLELLLSECPSTLQVGQRSKNDECELRDNKIRTERNIKTEQRL